MTWVVTAIGAALVLTALDDMFHTLFHPSGQGRLSWAVMRGIWSLSRGVRHRRVGTVVGPTAVSAAILLWAGLLIVGWALVYWQQIPEGVAYSPASAASGSDFVDALSLSMVTGATLGYGDIVPTLAWLRLAAPLQALMGFGLVTVAVTWVLQIYPALQRRRGLALRVAMLRRAHSAPALAGLDSSYAATLLDELATGLMSLRVDLSQYSETYFFREGEADAAMSVQVGHLVDLARAGAGARREDVRAAAAVLRAALDDLAGFLDTQFLHVGGTPAEAFTAFARDQGHEPEAS